MKSGEIWKAKDELNELKKTEDFWWDDKNKELMVTSDFIKLIDYIGDDLWKVEIVYPNKKTEKLREKHKKDSKLFPGSSMTTKFICQARTETLNGSIIHKYYTYAGDDCANYGPEPAYEVIFDDTKGKKK